MCAEEAEARNLVDETVALIDNVWLDARESGFNKDKWHALYDAAMQRPPLNAMEAHAMIRDLLARGPQVRHTATANYVTPLSHNPDAPPKIRRTPTPVSSPPTSSAP